MLYRYCCWLLVTLACTVSAESTSELPQVFLNSEVDQVQPQNLWNATVTRCLAGDSARSVHHCSLACVNVGAACARFELLPPLLEHPSATCRLHLRRDGGQKMLSGRVAFTRNQAWLAVQSRTSADVSFNRTKAAYVRGFGDYCGSYWIGLELMHKLTARKPLRARFLMQPWSSTVAEHADYSHFRVSNSHTGYKLEISGHDNDTICDDMSVNANGARFTTFDEENFEEWFCPAFMPNNHGWWFDVEDCGKSLPNNMYCATESCGSFEVQNIGWPCRFGMSKSMRYYEIQLLLELESD